MKKENKVAPKQQETVENKVATKQQPKVEGTTPKFKTKEEGYIHHNLIIAGELVDCVLGEDPTPLFKEIDQRYYEYRKKLYNGNIRKGTPFDCRVIRVTSNRPWEEKEVLYTPGSMSKNRFRRFDYEDEDEDEIPDYDTIVNGGY